MEFAAASLLVTVLASGWVWMAYFQRRLSRLDPRDPSQEDKPRLSLPAIVLVLLMMGDGLATQFRQPALPTSIDLSRLQDAVLSGVAISGMLVAALFLTPGLSFMNYGFHARSLPKQLACGGLAFLASLLPVYMLLLATSMFRSTETLHPFLKLLRKDPGGETVLWIALAVTVTAPIVEELTYRVVLQTTLAHWFPISVAWPLTAAIFCAMHGWPDMVPLLPLALVLGWGYHQHRSYLAIVTTHALFNAWMLAWAVWGPQSG